MENQSGEIVAYGNTSELTRQIIQTLHKSSSYKISVADEIEILSEQPFNNTKQSGIVFKIRCKSGNPMAYYWLGQEIYKRIGAKIAAAGPQMPT